MSSADSALAFPDEVVTSTPVRFINPPGLDGEFALITLENGLDHTKPTTLGPTALLNLERTLDEIADRGSVRAIGITGKPYFFGAGADLRGVAHLTSQEDGVAILSLGHRVFAKLRASQAPTFAFINGLALGGALELALHADYRTASTSAAGIALPEVSLGLAPGWGGSYLLPHLVGVEAALKVILENPLAQNRMLKPVQAFKMGLVDALFEPADFLARSISWAVSVVNQEATVDRPSVDTGEAWGFAVMVASKIADERLHGAAPAPLAALELVRFAKDATYEQAMAKEEELVSKLLVSPELRNSLYAFDLVQKRARKPAGAPDKSLARPVLKVGIVGAGLMASQLALLFARRLQIPVVMTDVDLARIDKGVAYVGTEVSKLVDKGRITSDEAARIRANVTGALDKSAFADADFVIEAVFEELTVKRQVFAEVERVVRPDCVLATNTSSLSVTDMAAGLKHPERLVGFHFFNPVAVLPLLEVVRTPQTDDVSLATAFAVAKGLKKSAVLVKDAPAFVVNRILVRSLSMVLNAIDKGADPIEANTCLDSLGFPMRPLELVELVGPAVALHVQHTLHNAFGDRFPISTTLTKAVELKKTALLVRKSGQPILDPDLTPPTRLDAPTTGPTADAIRETVLNALNEEIHLMLEDKVVAAPEDIDLCMLLGAGWPFHLGGITPYLHRRQ